MYGFFFFFFGKEFGKTSGWIDGIGFCAPYLLAIRYKLYRVYSTSNASSFTILPKKLQGSSSSISFGKNVGTKSRSTPS